MDDERKWQRNPLLQVGAAGAVGGLCAWAAAGLITDGAQPTGLVALVSYMLLGATSAVVFVFVLANTARDDVYRLVGLALVAGFFWRPVWDSAGLLVRNRQDVAAATKAGSALQVAASRLADHAEGSPPSDAEWTEIATSLQGAAIELESIRDRDAVNSLSPQLIELKQTWKRLDPNFSDPQLRAAMVRVFDAAGNEDALGSPMSGWPVAAMPEDERGIPAAAPAE